LKRVIFKTLRFFLFLSIGLFLLYLAVRSVNFEEFVDTLSKANFLWVALALFFALIGYMSRAYRWRLLIKPLNYNPPFRNVFYALMLGYTANFALPRIGEVTRCGSLRKSDRIPVDSLLGTVIIERAIDLVVLLTILVVIFFTKMEFFGGFFRQRLFRPLMDPLQGVAHFPLINWLIGLVVLAGIVVLVRFLSRKFSRAPVVIKVKKLIRGVIYGLKTIARMQDRWVFVLHTVIIWMMYFLMTYVLVFALPATNHLQPVDGLFLLVIGGLGMSAPVQGGLGVFHVITMLGLSLYGISESEGFAYAVLSHESQSLFAILLGGLSFIMLMIDNRKSEKRRKHGLSQTDSIQDHHR